MKKNSQKYIIVFLILAIILASFSFLFPDKKKGVLAQDEEVLVCREPISIGSSLDATLGAMDVLFKETQNIHREISAQVNAANTALASIGKDAVRCSTSTKVCKAMCPNLSPDIMLEATFLWFITLARWQICLPFCSVAGSCSGKPCPALDKQIGLIKDSLASTTKAIQKINDVFTGSTEQIEEDIMSEKESASFKQCLENAKSWLSDEAIKITKEELEKCIENLGEITKIEFAQRKLERTRADFHRWRMSSDDWGKVYREEIIPRTAMKCLEALEESFYWPKWWTDDCEEKCKDNPYKTGCQDCLCRGCESTGKSDPKRLCTDTLTTDPNPEKCQQCLDQSLIHQYSWIKATGCKFYGACRSKCEKAISVQEKGECLACLCTGLPAADECVQQHGGGDACDDECEKECKVVACQKWLCGRSMLNWTSCLSY